jgi:plastocyanin
MSTERGKFGSLQGATFPFKVVVSLMLVCAVVLSALIGTGVAQVSPAAAAPAVQSGPTTWTVLVGGQAEITQQEMGPAGAWQFMRFYPESITINVGDSVVWKLNSAEMHTVTFLKPGEKAPDLIIPEGKDSQRVMFNPPAVFPQGTSAYDGTALTSSGQLGGGPQFPTDYKLTFTTPGSYDYICTFHPMMKGKVIVQAADTPYPKTQAQIDAEANTQLMADMEAAMKAEHEGRAEGEWPSTRAGANGTVIHQVQMGYGDGFLAWMRFGPENLTIQAGDSVEWVQADMGTPHTVTFTSGDKAPELVLVEPQQAGPPNLIVNPEVLVPAGGSTYSGKGYFNSGFIWGTKDPMPGPRTYTLTFDTPGTYKYICVLHDEMGMSGQITVLPKSKG